MLTNNVLVRILIWILQRCHQLLNYPRVLINALFQNKSPFTISSSTALVISALFLWSKWYPTVRRFGVLGAFQLLFLSTLKRVPGGSNLIDAELEKSRQGMKEALKPPRSRHKVYHQLPEEGVSRQILREEMLFQLSEEKSMRKKRGHGGMYVMVHEKYDKFASDSEQKRREMAEVMDSYFDVKEEAYLYFSHTNTLYFNLFPGIRKFDLELISMASNMLHAPEPAGVLTSGGSESIFMAMKCWRSYGKKMRGIQTPNVVLCTTAHPAFQKALDYLQIEVRYVSMNTDEETFGTMNVDEMRSRIDGNTICIVASAPCYPYSVVDDVEAICAVAKSKGGVAVHVDHCYGGFCLSFLVELGVTTQRFDFSVDGVSSMSCDMHKQAGADKGCSAVIYRSFEVRRFQFYAFPNWPGGLYASSGLQGSSNGGLKAVAWAMLLHKGRRQLKEKAMNLFSKVERFKKLIAQRLDHCSVLGQPIACGVTFKFHGELEGLDYAVGEALEEVGGWKLSRMQFPSCLAFISSQHWIDQIDQLVDDIETAAKLVLEDPDKYNTSGMAGVYGTGATFPDRGLVNESIRTFLDIMMTPQEVQACDD